MLPLWNMTLSGLQRNGFLGSRINYEFPKYEGFLDYIYPEYWRPRIRPGNFNEEDMRRWEDENRIFTQPEPGSFSSRRKSQLPSDTSSGVDLFQQFSKEGLQVIVKLVNIELTPENPRYSGCPWRIEGQLVILPLFSPSSP